MSNKNLVLIFAALLLAACGQEDESSVRGCKEDQALGHDGLCYVQEAKVNEAGTQNLALLHKVAILGKHLKEEDVFRDFKRREVQKGGKFHATGVLDCLKDDGWYSSSAFAVQNRKGEKRLITAKHSLLKGKWDHKNEARNVDISSKCTFITSEDYFDAQRDQGKCYLPDRSDDLPRMGKFFSCMKSHGMLHEIHSQRQSLKVESNKSSDLAVLKFKNSSPRVIPFTILNLQNQSFTTEKDTNGNTFLILNGEKYRGILPSGGEGRVTKKSCSIYPKHSKQILSHIKNKFLADCHSTKGFSGSSFILEKESSGELLVPCMLQGSSWATKSGLGSSFNESISANSCIAITDEVFELLEK